MPHLKPSLFDITKSIQRMIRTHSFNASFEALTFRHQDPLRRAIEIDRFNASFEALTFRLPHFVYFPKITPLHLESHPAFE